LETSRTISEAVFPLEETKNRPTFAEHLALFLEEIKDFGRITVAMQRLIEAADGDNGVVFFTQDEMGETDLEILERRLRDSEVILEKYSIVRRKRPEDKGKEYRKEIGLRLEWKTEEKRKEEERRELAAARKLKAAKRAEEKRAEEEKNAAEAARLAEEARKKAEELKKAQEEARRKEKEKVAAEQAARVEKEAALAHARAEHEARLNYGYTIQTSFGKHIISVRTEPDFYRSLLAVQEAIRPLPSVQQADVEQVRAVRTRIEQGDKGTSGLIQPWREDTNTITIRRALRALDDMIIMMEKRVRKAEGELPKLRTFASPFGEEAERATGQLYADTFIYETPAPDKLKGVQLRVITRQHPGHKGNFPSGSQVVVMPMDSQANKSFEGEGIIVQTDILRVIGITERTPVKREQRVAGLYKDKTTYKVKTQAVKFEGLWNFRIRIMGSAHPDFAKVNVRAGHVPIVLINEEEAEVGYGTVPGNILESIVVPGLEQQAPQPAQAQQPTQGPRPPSQPTQAPTKPSSPSTPPASPSHITVQDIPLDQRGRDRGWTPRPKPQFQDRRPPFSPGGPRGPQGRPHGNSHGRRNDRRDDRHERPSRQQEELTGLCRTSREIELEDGTILPKNQMVEIIPKDSETAQLWLMETGEAGIGSKYRLIKILGGSSRMAKVLKNHLEPL
jgi:chemotaxis protein histidine kinase CheA